MRVGGTEIHYIVFYSAIWIWQKNTKKKTTTQMKYIQQLGKKGKRTYQTLAIITIKICIWIEHENINTKTLKILMFSHSFLICILISLFSSRFFFLIAPTAKHITSKVNRVDYAFFFIFPLFHCYFHSF